MIPAFLISFREVIEASLIIAAILGILVKLQQQKNIKIVWIATLAASITSILILIAASILGVQVRVFWDEKEALIEGVLMLLSSIFITWAVFVLHNYFTRSKSEMLQKAKPVIEENTRRGLFLLVYTSVLREGFEIVLFLSSILISENQRDIFFGFCFGSILALIMSFLLYRLTVKMPVRFAFQISGYMLILFAAGQLGRSMNEFWELGFVPELGDIHLWFLPSTNSFWGGVVQTVFGISRDMLGIQVLFYILHLVFMGFWFKRQKKN